MQRFVQPERRIHEKKIIFWYSFLHDGVDPIEGFSSINLSMNNGGENIKWKQEPCLGNIDNLFLLFLPSSRPVRKETALDNQIDSVKNDANYEEYDVMKTQEFPAEGWLVSVHLKFAQ